MHDFDGLKLPARLLRWWARNGIDRWTRASAYRRLSRVGNGCAGTIATRRGFNMNLIIGDPVDTAIAIQGEFEPGLSLVISRLANDARTFVDVGCNIGYFSCLFKTVSPDARVIAIDANGTMIERCLANLKLNGYSGEMEHTGIGSANGMLRFSLSPDRPSLGTFAAIERPNAVTIEVPVTTLSSIFERRNLTIVDVMKIDIEGYEPALFEGLRAEHAVGVRHILFEYAPQLIARAGFDPESIWRHDWWRRFELMQMSSVDGSAKAFVPGKSAEYDSIWARNRG